MKKILYIVISTLFISTALIATAPDLETYRMGAKSGSQVFPHKYDGFSGPEETHRWTEGNNATISIPIAREDNRRLKSVSFKAPQAFITPSYAQQLTVFLNGSKIHGFTYDLNNRPHSFQVDIPSEAKGDAVIKFDMPNACSPNEHSPDSNDSRKLAFAFDEIDILYWNNIDTYRLGTASKVPVFPFKYEGLSAPENTHIWTEGNNAKFTFPLFDKKQLRLASVTFNGTTGLSSPTHEQVLDVFLNNQCVSQFRYNSKKNNHTFKVEIPANFNDAAEIEFQMPQACSPNELDPNAGDNRKLAIALDGINLEYQAIKSVATQPLQPILSANLLKGYDSLAQNAAMIVYGTSKRDNEIYVLFCFDKRGFWTVPGGKRETNHQTIIDTAVEELYEETAAYAAFNPSIVKPLLEQQSDKSVYQTVGKKSKIQTDLFAFCIDSISTLAIEDLSKIADGSQQRIQGLNQSFDEMSAWQIVPLSTVHTEFVTNARSKKSTSKVIGQQTFYMYDVEGLGEVPSASYNSLKLFFQRGSLYKLMKAQGVSHQRS